MATEKQRRAAFFQSMLPFAQRWSAQTGIPASVLLGWMASESNFGKASSLFGVKGSGDAGSSSYQTFEVQGNQEINLTDSFANYSSPDAAFQALINLVSTAPRYADAWRKLQAGDWQGFLTGLNAAGYATDPSWANKVQAIAAEVPEYIQASSEGGGGAAPTSGGTRASWMDAPITQGFGPTDVKLDGPYKGAPNFNKGYDFGVPIGTPIDANIAGTVIAAGDQGDGWGISVKVRDAQGNIHNYGHLSAADVQVGQQITPGMVLGKSGNTGKSTGPHLSYDVLSASGEYVDPAPWYNGQPTEGVTAPRLGTLPSMGSGPPPNPLVAMIDKVLRGVGLTSEEMQQVMNMAGDGGGGGSIPEGASTEGLEGTGYDYWDPTTGLPAKVEDNKQRTWSKSAIEKKVRDGELTGDQGAMLWRLVNQDNNVNPAVLESEENEIRGIRPQSSFSFIDSGQGVVRLNTATGEAYYIGPDGTPISVSPAIDPAGTSPGRFGIENFGDGSVRVSDKQGGGISEPFKLPSGAKKLSDLTPSDYTQMIKWGMPLADAKRMFREQFGAEMTPEKLAVEIAKLEQAAQTSNAPYSPNEIKALLDAGIIDQAQAQAYMEQAVTDPLLRQLAMKQLEPGAQYSPSEIRQLFEAGLIDQTQAEGFMEAVYDDPLLRELAMQSLKPKPSYTPAEVQRLYAAGLMDYEEAARVMGENYEDPRLLQLALQGLQTAKSPQQVAAENARGIAQSAQFRTPGQQPGAAQSALNVMQAQGSLSEAIANYQQQTGTTEIPEMGELVSFFGATSGANTPVNRNVTARGEQFSLSPMDAAQLANMSPGDRTRALRELTGQNMTLAEESAFLGSSVAGTGFDISQMQTFGVDAAQQYQQNYESFLAAGLSPQEADWRAKLQVEGSRMANEQARTAGQEEVTRLNARGFDPSGSGGFQLSGNNTVLNQFGQVVTGEQGEIDIDEEAFAQVQGQNLDAVKRAMSALQQGNPAMAAQLLGGIQPNLFNRYLSQLGIYDPDLIAQLRQARAEGAFRARPPTGGSQIVGNRVTANVPLVSEMAGRDFNRPNAGDGGPRTPRPEQPPVMGTPPSPPGPIRYQPEAGEAPSPVQPQQQQAAPLTQVVQAFSGPTNVLGGAAQAPAAPSVQPTQQPASQVFNERERRRRRRPHVVQPAPNPFAGVR